VERVVLGCLRLRTVVVAIAAVLMAAGIWQLRQMPLDIVPEFSPLTLQVRTEALGLSAAEVESLITVPLEADLLIGVPWLKSIESESITGVSSIDLLFEPGTDLIRARQMVNERMTQARALPNVSTPPTLLQPVATANRIMNIGLSSKSVSLIDVSTQAQWTIVPRLTGVPGVANVSIWGQRNLQVQVLVDPAKLHSKSVTLDQVVKTTGEAVWSSPLTYLNSSTPGAGGFIDMPNQRLNVRHVFPITAAEDFAAIPVVGTSLALREVADVVEAHQPLIGDAILKDGPGLLLVVEKYPGFNTIKVTEGVEAALAELRSGMTGIDVDTTIYRPASFIERATSNLSLAAIAAAILTVIALFALLGSWRVSLVAVVSTASALAAAFLVFQLRGVGFNMMVVAGLLVAIAVVVDDAIVSAHNVQRRLREVGNGNGTAGPAWRVIANAATEVGGSMLYATLIIVVAMGPVLLMRGLSAAFFDPLALSYIIAVIVSLVIATTVTPALAMLLAPRVSAAPSEPAFVGRILRQYSRMARSAMRAPSFAWGLVAAGVLVCVLVFSQRERSLIPSFKETDIFIELTTPPGTSLQAMDRMTAALIHDVRGVPGVRNAAAQVGRALLSHETADVNSAEVWVSLDPNADYRATLGALRGIVSAQTGVSAEVQTFLSKRMRESLTGEDEAVSVRIYGQDLGILRAKADEIRQTLGKIEGIKNVKAEQQDEQLAIDVAVDLEKARAYGLKPGDVRRATSALIGGITVGSLFQEQKVFDVVVWGSPDHRRNLEDIRNLLIDTESGSQVRLADIAHVDYVPTPSVIHREGASRRIDVEAEVSGRSLAAVTNEVKERIKEGAFPFEYHAEVLGEHIERRAALGSLYSYLIAAAVGIVLLLQAALGSWRLAGLVIIGMPVAALGGFLSAYVGGSVISLGAFIGIVAILGLAVRNGIMLIRQIQALEQREAAQDSNPVLRAAGERFQPVVATAIVTGLIALPFVALGDVAGLEILHPAGVTMLGGLVTSTILTLFVTPALYGRFVAKAAAEMPPLAPEVA
jgi:CzcA family heavy metal efflux pump